MPKVNDILELLENGKWHDLKKIGKKIQIQDLEIVSVAKFLAQYEFVRLDKKEKKAKLDSSMRDFLEKIRRLEGEEKP